MDQLFPYAHIAAGVLIICVGFVFHWIGQFVCLIDWDFATKIGLAEKGILPEYRVYEHAIATADVAIGWIYGIAGLGLLLDTEWGYKLAWFPGVVFVYHSISYWFWTRNRRKSAHRLETSSLRIGWSAANFATGVLVILVAWNAS
ncbi:MAG: hypothetical protein GTO29_08910 [Candidatus Latescibacteria bacterium]|nr:hypothetical protein [Candidatus Latescibacterota bacterium]NIO56283.1 hypothetical protein [Candidatus Latescibacterota bacterium]